MLNFVEVNTNYIFLKKKLPLGQSYCFRIGLINHISGDITELFETLTGNGSQNDEINHKYLSKQ